MSPQNKVMAIAPFVGHWVQLMRMRPAWDDCDLTYVATSKVCRDQVIEYAKERNLKQPRFYAVPDADRSTKVRLLAQFVCVAWLTLRTRPDVVISTGAAVGLLAIFFGRLLGARTVWVDSIANAEKLSLSGNHAGRFTDLWLTQWPHLASPKGPSHVGSVLWSSYALERSYRSTGSCRRSTAG